MKLPNGVLNTMQIAEGVGGKGFYSAFVMDVQLLDLSAEYSVLQIDLAYLQAVPRLKHLIEPCTKLT